MAAVPYDERDDDSGQFTPTFTDKQFLSAVEESDLPTTSDIADAVGCKYRTAYARLGDLEEEGTIASRSVGNSLVWTIVEEDSE